MEKLARNTEGRGTIYFTGGATALMSGLREQTIDVNIKLDPEPKGAFEAISRLKNDLDINIKLASPVDFIPVPADWREQSTLAGEHGQIRYYHFDLRAQVLSKIERGHHQDLQDAREFMRVGNISAEELWASFLATKSSLIRYPALDAAAFEQKVKAFWKP